MKNLIVIAFFLICISCNENDQPTVPLVEPTSELINAENGGTIKTEDGYSLEIPPGALSEDTEINLTPLQGNEMHEWCVSSVSLEPDGLTFDKPAKLSFPMPSSWPEDHNPLVLIAFGENPGDYFSMDLCAEVRSTDNGLVTQIEIDHFSKYGVIGNCHKGTLAFLLNNFEQRGCNNSDTWKKVTDKYGNINTNIDVKPETGHETLQAFLGVYFQSNSAFEKDQAIGNKWIEIVDFIKNKNQRVIVLFAKDKWSSKTSRGFYRSVPHSATLEIKDGKLKLRNSVAANKNVRDALTQKNGDNVLWYPSEDRDITAQDLEDLRNSSPIDVLQNALNNRPDLFSNIPQRKNKPKPWTAIRFYVANRKENDNPCSETEHELLKSNRCQVKINLDARVKEVWDTTNYEYDMDLGAGVNAAIGSFSENIFIGNWDNDYDFNTSNSNYTGSVMVKLNDELTIVTSVTWTEDYKYYGADSNLNFKSTYSFTGNNLPLYSDLTPGVFQIYAVETCDHLSSVEYSARRGSNEISLVNYSCVQNSYLRVIFWEE